MHDNSSESSDIEIIRRITDGDINAYELLLKRYETHVLKIVKKHVPYQRIEEITQDVFVRSYQSLPNFKEKSSFKRWLTSIALRTCYDFWRKEYRCQETPISTLSIKHNKRMEHVVYDQSNREFSEEVSHKEAKEILDWALDRLTPKDRMVLELVYLEGLTGKEVSDILGWSVANVKVRSFRSRKKLKKLLSGLIER